MLKTTSVWKSVDTAEGKLDILKGIDLEINQGESVAIIGASGSGKSTLLSLLAGLDVASSGTIVLADKDISTMNEDGRAALRSEHVGFVFQSFQLLPGLTALENVMLPLELKKEPSAKTKAMSFLDRVGLHERASHYPSQLSGGEQQRVAMARAFASEPHILFADEPTGNLDSKTGAHVIELLFELNASSDCTLVLVTHEERLAQRCERRLQMEAGELAEVFEEA